MSGKTKPTKTTPPLAKPTSFREEIANSITHGLGAALSIAGLTILVVWAAQYGNVWHVVSVSIYGSSLIVLYRRLRCTIASDNRALSASLRWRTMRPSTV